MIASQFPAGEPTASKIRVFVSYDREHDGDLYDRLAEQASRGPSGFEIVARSRERSMVDLWEERLRRELRAADEVIVICGEHTTDSPRMAAELSIVQEEQRPYFLLWGRRELMCTKPRTAKSGDGMYSWTWEILQDQILCAARHASRSSERIAAELRRPKPTPKT